MSHELFHDVTDRRPTQGKARGGTLFISILAHAAILIAVVVVPLMATDVLPTITDGLAEYAVPVDLPAPVAVQRPQTRTPAVAPTNVANVAPVEPPDAIVDEAPMPNALVCAACPVVPASHDGLPVAIGQPVAAAPEPPPPPVVPKIIRATALNMPKKIHDVAPEYPALALSAHVEGVVIIEAVIGVDGSIRDAHVLRSQPLLDRAAIDAVRQWRYEPTRLNGQPVPVIVTVTVQFHLQR